MFTSLCSLFSASSDGDRKHDQGRALIRSTTNTGRLGSKVEETKGELEVTGVTADSSLGGCIFCDVSREKGFNVVYEDEKYVVFKDHRPAAAQHLLVVPRRHIDSVRTLTPEDVPTVKRMAEIGHSILDEMQIPFSNRRLGFHIPPFYSVKHLHLHVQATPYKSWLKRAKYPVAQGSKGYSKGFGWFVEVEQAIAIVEKGERVKISSC
ncbi:HIT-like protein [Irpex rosettiformis]|uniref:HIT-like protein n=1 Tax=Irpex rosettiformis TaxID=378272 RepID=A0ACB8UAI2_9APHY|nr:HIT-like protein [Irpex rosettiformis]